MRPRSPHALSLCTLGVLLAALTVPAPAGAQTSISAPSITGFVQAGFHAQLANDPYTDFTSVIPPGPDVGHGFFLNNARLYFAGSVGEAFRYSLKTELRSGFSGVLAAQIMWQFGDVWTLTAGQMLKPFGRDRTRAKHRLLTFDRSMASTQLVNTNRYGSWDVGAKATYQGEGVTAQVGLFNGEPAGAVDDVDSGKNLVGRLTFPIGSLEVGASASFLHDSTRPSEERVNMAYGVDGLYESGPMSLEFEVVMADRWTDGTAITPALKSQDYGVTFAYGLGPIFGTQSSQFVLRAEQYDPDTDADDDEMTALIPSLNLSVSEVSRFQVGIVHQTPSAPGVDASQSFVLMWQVDFF